MTENNSAISHIAPESSGESASTLWEVGYPKIFGRMASKFIAGIFISVAGRSETAIQGVPYWEHMLRQESAITWVYQFAIGRPISRAEALAIVQNILERAEQERMEISEAEARVGFQWGEDL